MSERKPILQESGTNKSLLEPVPLPDYIQINQEPSDAPTQPILAPAAVEAEVVEPLNLDISYTQDTEKAVLAVLAEYGITDITEPLKITKSVKAKIIMALGLIDGVTVSEFAAAGAEPEAIVI